MNYGIELDFFPYNFFRQITINFCPLISFEGRAKVEISSQVTEIHLEGAAPVQQRTHASIKVVRLSGTSPLMSVNRHEVA